LEYVSVKKCIFWGKIKVVETLCLKFGAVKENVWQGGGACG